jgi:hypothetical protein
MKVTPDFSLLENYPTLILSDGCHVHVRLAMEKCPVCKKTLYIVYMPTDKHPQGVDSTDKSSHNIVVSCTCCNFIVEVMVKEGLL